MKDVAWAIRSLRTAPAFTATAALILALGIGASTAVYTVLYAAMLRPLPYEDPDRIVTVLLEDDRGGWSSAAYALGDALVSGGALDAMAPTIFDDGHAVGGGEPELLRGIDVGADYFRVVVPPMLGRAFIEGEQDVVVITHGLWQRRFGGNPNVVGRTLTLSPHDLLIVGVMPASFRSLERVEFLKPIALGPGDRLQHGAGPFELYGRVPGHLTVAQAQSAADTILERLRQAFPDAYESRRVRLMTYRRLLSSEWDRLFLVIAGAVGFVLLLSCTNVATLLMVRSTARTRELAVRASLGASRARLVRQQLIEGTLLAFPAAGLGVLFAWWMLSGLLALIPERFPRFEDTRIDGAVLVVAAAVSIGGAIMATVWPAIAGGRTDVVRALRAEDGGTGRQWRTLHAFIAVEVALTAGDGYAPPLSPARRRHQSELPARASTRDCSSSPSLTGLRRPPGRHMLGWSE